jgi:hypothetical protein
LTSKSPLSKFTSEFDPSSPAKRQSEFYTGEDMDDRQDLDKKGIKFGNIMQVQKVSIQDKQEESRERYITARKYVRELLELKIWEDSNGNVLNKKKILEECDKVLKIAENVFLLMNIRVKEIVEPLSDSAMTIYPADEKQELASFYQMNVPEICDFPYAFLAKLKICLITICGDVSLFNQGYSRILEQKMNNGLFVLKELKTPEDVRDFWYKIILCHFIKVEPEMYENWKELLKNEGGAGSRKKGELGELVDTLKCVMKPQELLKTTLPQVQLKMKFLKKELRNFEPICFDEEWWDMKHQEMYNSHKSFD